MLEFSLNGERIMVIGAAQFLIRSWTFPEEWHCVDYQDGTLNCTCRGADCGFECRHLKAIKALYEQQPVPSESGA